MFYGLNMTVLLLLLLMVEGYTAEGTLRTMMQHGGAYQPRLVRGCHLPRRRVHLPSVALPAWFELDGAGSNWPQMIELDVDPKEDTYMGQSMEDKFAYDNLFFKRASGIYLEFGAADGKWRGMLLEANPDSYSRLVRNRPGDISIHTAVCANFTQVHFVSDNMVGGIWEFMTPTFRTQSHPNVTLSSLPTVSCLPLTHLLAKFGVRHLNLMSMDVEGGELEVLRTLDFDCITIDVIVAEASNHSPERNQAVRDLLFSKGYQVIKAKQNDWFVHRSYVPSARPELAPLSFENR